MCGGKTGIVFVQKHLAGEVRVQGLDEKSQDVNTKFGPDYSREGRIKSDHTRRLEAAGLH